VEKLLSIHCANQPADQRDSHRLAGPSVCATRSPPQQPTELIYCTALVCSKKKREYPRRSMYVNLSLTCLTDPEDDAISIEPRTFDHSARAQEPQLFAVSASLVLAIRSCESWIISPVYKLMTDSESLTSHQRVGVYRTPLVPNTSYGLQTDPDVVASNHATYAR
jgi:hypothetical protein